MKLLRPVRVAAAALAVMTLSACAQPGSPLATGEPRQSPSSSVSRIRVTNDSTTAITGLLLLFPEDQVAVGDVGAGATSDYVVVPNGVYGYSAFGYTLEGKHVVQPVVDFVGESPLPLDDYTYLLGVDAGSDRPIELLTVLRADPATAGTGETWVRVLNQGPHDLAGLTMRFPGDERIYLGPIPAGASTEYARLYGTSGHTLSGLEYAEDGRTVTQSAAPAGASTGSATGGTVAYVLRYDRGAPESQHVQVVEVRYQP